MLGIDWFRLAVTGYQMKYGARDLILIFGRKAADRFQCFFEELGHGHTIRSPPRLGKDANAGYAAAFASIGTSRALLSVRTARRSVRPRISISCRSAPPSSTPARVTTASETTSSAL
jgi:hypothetical protein